MVEFADRAGVHAGLNSLRRFQSALGIAKNILANRLERLTQLGILERYPLDERANADRYRLTKKGEELYPILVALMQWGDRWATPSKKPSVALVDNATGRSVEAIKVRGKDGRPLSFRDVRFAEGPGGRPPRGPSSKTAIGGYRDHELRFWRWARIRDLPRPAKIVIIRAINLQCSTPLNRCRREAPCAHHDENDRLRSMRWPETACFTAVPCWAAASWWPARWAQAQPEP